MTKTTLLELIDAISDFAATEAELVATVVYVVNSGKVVLNGTFRGCTFALDDPALASGPSRSRSFRGGRPAMPAGRQQCRRDGNRQAGPGEQVADAVVGRDVGACRDRARDDGLREQRPARDDASERVDERRRPRRRGVDDPARRPAPRTSDRRATSRWRGSPAAWRRHARVRRPGSAKNASLQVITPAGPTGVPSSTASPPGVNSRTRPKLRRSRAPWGARSGAGRRGATGRVTRA
jgi:hypothetical protein